MEPTTLSVVDKWMESAQQGAFIHHATSEQWAAQLAQLPFPSTKMEDWKYTRTQRLAQVSWKLVTGNVMSDPEFESVVPEIVIQEKGFFPSINAAFPTQAWKIEIPENAVEEEAFQFVFKVNGDQSWTQPRFVVKAKKNSQSKFVFHFESTEQTLVNAVLEVKLDEGAVVDIDIIQDFSDESFQVLDVVVDQERSSTCNVVTHSLNGGWVRNNLLMTLNGEGSHAGLAGFYLPHQSQLIDNHTVVDHKVPNCTSNELYKGVLYDQSRGVFNGKVFVRRDAQKTEAYQSNKNIMMSDTAIMDSKPELEIYADDVRCSHGSTTGQFDEEALFYLRARGLSAEGAKQLLVSAYVKEVIDRSSNPAVVTYVKQELAKRGRIIADEI
jgi:Fe-S cluster assembly protein SufD